MSKVSITFSGETMADVYAEIRRELDRIGGSPVLPPAPAERLTVDGSPSCPNGHGPMVRREGGTIRAGARIGQTYPPFFSCGTCKETREISA